MKIAFLSDIHANLPALQAALAAVRRLEVQRLVVAGDLVGDGPHPVEVVSLIRQREVECVRGNVDREVLRLALGERKLGKRIRAAKGQKSNRAWHARQLRDSPEDLDWLTALPEQIRLHAAGHDVLVVHGSPRGDTDYLYPTLTPAALAIKLQPLGGYRPAVLVSGHSHLPFARDIDGVLVVNCGSVGRPADGDPRGTFAVVDLGGPTPSASIIRFAYPLPPLLADLAARRVPGMEAEEYRLGVKG